MAYKPNIPLATDQLSVSQGDIQGNFQSLQYFADSVALFDTAVPPVNPPTTAATQVGLYATNSAYTGAPAIFVRKASSGTSAEITSYGNIAAIGWTQLPSGLILKWGKETTVLPSGGANVNMNAAGTPPYTSVFNAQATIVGFTTTGMVKAAISGTDLLINTVNAAGAAIPAQVYWFAIGI